MTIAHDENATSWRDLADQLTDDQIAELEYCERENIPPGLSTPQHRMNAARAMARQNIMQALCADIAPPPDAAGPIYEWEARGMTGTDACTRSQPSAPPSNMQVDVLGVQHDDGRIDRFICANPCTDNNGADTTDLTAAQAREPSRRADRRSRPNRRESQQAAPLRGRFR